MNNFIFCSAVTFISIISKYLNSNISINCRINKLIYCKTIIFSIWEIPQNIPNMKSIVLLSILGPEGKQIYNFLSYFMEQCGYGKSIFQIKILLCQKVSNWQKQVNPNYVVSSDLHELVTPTTCHLKTCIC